MSKRTPPGKVIFFTYVKALNKGFIRKTAKQLDVSDSILLDVYLDLLRTKKIKADLKKCW